MLPDIADKDTVLMPLFHLRAVRKLPIQAIYMAYDWSLNSANHQGPQAHWRLTERGVTGGRKCLT
jgi:hypothetical protein